MVVVSQQKYLHQIRKVLMIISVVIEQEEAAAVPKEAVNEIYRTLGKGAIPALVALLHESGLQGTASRMFSDHVSWYCVHGRALEPPSYSETLMFCRHY